MLSDEVWRDVTAQGRVQRYRARERMLRQGEPGACLLALTDGLTKVVRRENDGATTWLAFRGPGELLGEMSVFDGTVRTADVYALTPCTTVKLEAGRFRRYVEQRGLVMPLMQQTLQRMRESDQHRAELLTLPVIVRLARSLFRLAELGDRSRPATQLRLTGLTQEEIAQAIGVTRNCALRGLRELRRAGVLETARRVVVITDPEALRDWAAFDQYSVM